MLFIYTSYTANIVALLQSTSNKINTLEDLLNSDMVMATDDTPFNRFWLPQAVGKTRQAIYDTKIAPPNEKPHWMNMSYGVSKMREANKGKNFIVIRICI